VERAESGGRVGTITEFPIPTPVSQASGITVGPDGALWFTEVFGDNIGRLQP
jgi:virginiamycin B lyase